MGTFGTGRHKSPTPTRRRAVIVSKREPQRTLWAFGYLDLAALFGVKPETVRHWVCQNHLDPGDLVALCKAWQHRQDRVKTLALYEQTGGLAPGTLKMDNEEP